MNYGDTLIAMLAPQEIIDAAKRIDANQYGKGESGKAHRRMDEHAVSRWYNQAAGQDRYGK